MTPHGTPGPGGFGPSPGFGHPHPGMHLVPMQTRPRAGVHSGPTAVATTHPWLWVALTALILLAVGAAILLLRRRRTNAATEPTARHPATPADPGNATAYTAHRRRRP